MRSLSIVILALVLAVPAAAQEPVDRAAATIDADFLLGHTRFLASDLLQGRGPGTRGEALAQEYIAAQWESFGLEPAGTEGWLQPFRLLGLTVTSAPALTVRGPAGEGLELAWREEWIGSSGRQEERSELDDVEVVFVGYGIVAPEVGWDDYEDVDVAGKVLLFLNNDPVSEDFAGETRLYYGRWSYKYEIAAEKGAAGALVIHTTPSAGYGWNVVQSSWSGAQFELPAGEVPGVEVEAWLTEDAARRLAREPVVPNCDIAANINIDGGNIWGRTRDVRQVGRGKSDLDRLLDRFAAQQERTVLPEEFPDKGYYYRSDQFSFAKVGIPAIYLDEGVDFIGRPEGWGQERIDEWLERDYHQPSDEVTPEWDLSGAAEDDRLLFGVGHALAQSDDRPAWTPGDEFAAARAACP